MSIADAMIMQRLHLLEAHDVELRPHADNTQARSIYDVHHDGRRIGNLAVMAVTKAPGLPPGARGGKLGVRIDPAYRGNPRLVMSAMRQLRSLHPDLTHVGGFRLSGTRADASRDDSYTWVPLGEEADYRIDHQPLEDGPPIHNLLQPDAQGGRLAPDDIYTHTHYYRTGADKADAESTDAIHSARHDRPLFKRPAKDNSQLRALTPNAAPHLFADRPEETDEQLARRKERRAAGDHHVWIYRSAPRGVKEFNHGDWVSPSSTYSRDHGRHSTDKTKDWPVYKARVLAKHVRWPGDSINEFGYFGPPVKAQVHHRGGKNADRVT